MAMWGVFVQKCTARSSSVRFNPTMYGFTPLCINAYIQLFFSYATSIHTQNKTKQYSAGDVERAYAAWRDGEHCNKKIKPLHCNKKNIKPFHCNKKNIKPLHCNEKKKH